MPTIREKAQVVQVSLIAIWQVLNAPGSWSL